ALRGLRGENATEIKICGVTREEDVETCLDLGVDWIGLVFAARSPRRVTLKEGRFLRMRAKGEVPPRREGGDAKCGAAGSVKGVVAVFAGNSEAEIREVIEHVRPDAIQMPLSPLNHSRKSLSSDIPFWNTIRVGRDDLSPASGHTGDALHFDTSVAGVSGGSGKTFDWTLLSAVDRSRPVILAGGLKPENVADAVRRVRPDVVDAASGVETAPGIKDRARIAAFVREVRRV
ncbi:MAG: phosphoribosylanthranilate isomerase, partial [Thermoanaerobaculia bacterium]|nr:phosphoribosylanthranilate isomerase [Thermoanaerobaculia bacterium]